MAFVINVPVAPVDSRDYVLRVIYYSVLEPHRCAKHNLMKWNKSGFRSLMRNIMWLVNTPSKHETLTRCWSTVCDAGQASSQHAGLVVLTADTDPMSVKCWASVAGAGQYPFSPSQHFMLAVPAYALTKAGLLLACRLWCLPVCSMAPNMTR